MAQIEIPDVQELKQYGVIKRFVNKDLKAELVYVFLVLTVMTILAVGFGDPMTPFHSFSFVFGVAAVFFFSVTFSTFPGLVMAAGVMALMLCTTWSAGTARLNIFLVESPFLALFFIGVAVLPNLMPVLLEQEAVEVEAERQAMEEKAAGLDAQLVSLQREAKSDQMDVHKKDNVKRSTRTTVLHAFSRELLQSSSQREMLNVLFHTLTRTFGVLECAMFIPTGGNDELTIARIIHPDQSALENTKLDSQLPLLQRVISRKIPAQFDVPTAIDDNLETSLLIPILVDGEVYAIFSVGKFKTGPLQAEEAEFILELSTMTNSAIEQLKMVLAVS